ncbi:MAG TPA: hypothetical protein VE133_11960, partial [Candidatus Sulfotelmatobacter sp.]|nr:hypothetical protein [Candidatus Sulfotelmatobacter sp.]
MKQLRLNLARDAVLSAIHADVRAQVLHEFDERGARVFILAGALRDAITAHYEGEGDGGPRDFDIAVANVRREVFDELLLAFGRKNRHCGYA